MNRLLSILIVLAVLGGIGGVVAVVVLSSPAGGKSSGLGERFELKLDELRAIRPEKLSHRLAVLFETGFARARGVAVGPDGRVYVAGDRAVRVFDASGDRLAEWPLSKPPACVAVGDGVVYVGSAGRVDLLSPGGEPIAHWPGPGEGYQATCIAPAEGAVLAAFYHESSKSGLVAVFDGDGRIVRTIRGPGDTEGGFKVPSPYFDVATAPDGLLYVADPGRHRVEMYSLDGVLRGRWGTFGQGFEDFCGCCNPGGLAVLPDGRLVTSEKGLPTIKISSPEGRLVSVVAGPQQIGQRPAECTNFAGRDAADVAIDPAGRIVALDSWANVRSYEKKTD
jgi:hypothetical protein